MKTIQIISVLALIGNFVAPSNASAATPTDRPVPEIFSQRSTNAFKFYMSSAPGQIFFVPKSGGVRLDGDLTNPVPQFSASTVMGTWMPFMNKPLVTFGGTLTTSNHIRDFAIMQAEAISAGFSVTPAPVTSSTTTVLLKGGLDPSTGRVQARCEEKEFTLQDTDENGDPIFNDDGTPKLIKVAMPVCYVQDPRDPTKEIRTDLLIEYDDIEASSTDVEADYSFQATVHPANANLIKNKLRTGANWSDVIAVRADWTINQEGTPRYAEVEVNWKSVFEQTWAKAALHNFACIDIQFETLIRDVTTCDGQPGCGVTVHWFDENGNELPRGVLPPGAEFGDVVNGVVDKIQKELAQAVMPVLGDPGDVNSSSAIFTVKANFQKISIDRHETIPVYYFPRANVLETATTMAIGCLKGEVDQLILWNTANPACRGMLQDSNLGPGGQ